MAERWVVNASPVILLGKADVIPGEAEVISWALHNPGFTVILDDRRARQFATRNGLKVLGTLRIIVLAKQQGLIANAKPALEKLRGVGAWVSDELIDRAIALAGEV